MKSNFIYIFYSVVSLSFFSGFSQTVNEGILTVTEGTEVSTLFDFSNEKEGKIKNDGTIFFYSHFTNEGIYTFNKKSNGSYAVFQPYDEKIGTQNLKGSGSSEFYDVLFNGHGFELQNDFSIGGKADFRDGIVQVDSSKGSMSFQKGATAINTSDDSHVDGNVEKIGNEAFIFPVGNEGFYRYASISAPKTLKDAFTGKYYYKNSNLEQPHKSKTGVVEWINDKEYWTIERGDNTKSDIILTLSWDDRTTPSELFKEGNEIHIVRWDLEQKLWVDEGGIVDESEKTVTTPTSVDGYGIFTFATVKSNLILDGDIVVYNAVTPNGDGKNDYFIIDNIDKYPNNTVDIYNRWGVKVFSTKGYNNVDNNFKGFSDGRVTIKKNDKLPSGTYYYVLKYEYNNKDGSRMITKSGYLHLEND